MDPVSQHSKLSVQVQRNPIDIHWDQGIVERWNRTLAERLFRHHYAQEMQLLRATEWIKRLPAFVAALNGEVTRLTSKKPSDAIKAKIDKMPSSTLLAVMLAFASRSSLLGLAFASFTSQN